MDFHRSTKCWWLDFGPFTVIRKVDMQAGDCLGLGGANKLGKFSKPLFCDEDDNDDLKNPEQNTFEDDGDRPSTSKNTKITKNGLMFFFFVS